MKEVLVEICEVLVDMYPISITTMIMNLIYKNKSHQIIMNFLRKTNKLYQININSFEKKLTMKMNNNNNVIKNRIYIKKSKTCHGIIIFIININPSQVGSRFKCSLL